LNLELLQYLEMLLITMCFYGYYRKDLFPTETLKTATDKKYCITISSFAPPEMIVQDELHLMDGHLEVCSVYTNLLLMGLLTRQEENQNT
jgi:hypothetical protein